MKKPRKKISVPIAEWERKPKMFLPVRGPMLPVVELEHLQKMEIDSEQAYQFMTSKDKFVLHQNYYLCTLEANEPWRAFMVKVIQTDVNGEKARLQYYNYTAYSPLDVFYVDAHKKTKSAILKIPGKENEEVKLDVDNKIAALGQQMEALVAAQTTHQAEMNKKMKEFLDLQKSEKTQQSRDKGREVAEKMTKQQEWQKASKRIRPVTISNIPYEEKEDLTVIVQKIFKARNDKLSTPAPNRELKFTARRAIAPREKVDETRAPPRIIVVLESQEDRNDFLRNPKTAITVGDVLIQAGADKKDQLVYVNESLSRNKRQLFFVTKIECKKLGIRCRAKDNKVWVKPGPGIPELEIRNVEDLEDMSTAWNSPQDGSKRTEVLRQHRKLQARLSQSRD